MFTVTFVCTGNRCRSALAQSLLADKAAALPVRASSCGTLDIEGASSPRETVAAAKAIGLDLSQHRSRHFLGCDLASQDLVLGFEFEHVARAVIEGGAQQEKSFLLPELLRLLGEADVPSLADPVERARSMVAAADAARSSARRFVPGEEIPDPIGRPFEVHLDTARTLAELCDRLVSALFPAPGIRLAPTRA
jgi:protein-tyrosine phosphatase